MKEAYERSVMGKKRQNLVPPIINTIDCKWRGRVEKI